MIAHREQAAYNELMQSATAKIVIFGSSQPQPGSANYQLAYDIGRLCAEAGYVVVNGGYGGTMEASARGAKEVGGQTIGVTCDALGRSGPNAWIDREIPSPDLTVRLQNLIDLGDAYIALPGATGTLLELAMVWELIAKNFPSPRPIIAITNYWQGLIDILVGSGETDGSAVTIVPTPAEAVNLLQSRLSATKTEKVTSTKS